MGTTSTLFRTFRAALAAAMLASASIAPAGAVTGSGEPSAAVTRSGEIVVAQADCYAIGQQVAAQNGGTLAKAQAANQGGQQVCIIVILVPGKDGQRPRRAEFVVPAG